MQFLTQTIIAAALLAGFVFTAPSPQGSGAPLNGGSGGIQGECNFFCCERNLGTGGTLCKNNTTIPHPFSDDCSTMPIGKFPNGDGKAVPVCCANPNCANQPGWNLPITNV